MPREGKNIIVLLLTGAVAVGLAKTTEAYDTPVAIIKTESVSDQTRDDEILIF